MRIFVAFTVWILMLHGNCWTFGANNRKLLLTNVLIRHGDRAPLLLLNKASEEFWPEGAGQLTNLGKAQTYELGKYFRHRYASFLGDSYNRTQFSAWSTNVDRTLMSAFCYLAGFFSPIGSQIWNKELLWQPIPVRVTLEKPSTPAVALSSRCKKYLEKFRGNGADINEDIKMTDLLQILSLDNIKLTWPPLSKVTDFFDAIHVMHMNNVTLPSWVNPTILLLVEGLRVQGFKMLTKIQPSRNKYGGPLLWRITCNMQSFVNRSDTATKMHLYSGHDVTVNGILSSLGVIDSYIPLYASSVMIELSEIDNSYFVEVLYRNGTESSPYNYKLPGCSVPCPFEMFVNLYQDGLSCQDAVPQECAL